MASVHREIPLAVPAEKAWDAVRDIGEVHRRLVPGVLTDAHLDGDARVVTFAATGSVIRERVVAIDDDTRRFTYAVVDGPFPFQHHQATMQVVSTDPSSCRVVWTTDLLPDDLAGPVGELMDQGGAAMQRALGGG